jgi:hypothetical protein
MSPFCVNQVLIGLVAQRPYHTMLLTRLGTAGLHRVLLKASAIFDRLTVVYRHNDWRWQNGEGNFASLLPFDRLRTLLINADLLIGLRQCPYIRGQSKTLSPEILADVLPVTLREVALLLDPKDSYKLKSYKVDVV